METSPETTSRKYLSVEVALLWLATLGLKPTINSLISSLSERTTKNTRDAQTCVIWVDAVNESTHLLLMLQFTVSVESSTQYCT